MPEVKFLTSDFGIIKHGENEYEVVEHNSFFDTEKAAKEKIDELYEEE